MKILVLSDTHKDVKRAKKIINSIKSKVNMVIHLGDNISDAEDLSYEFNELPFHYVAGNCDFSTGDQQEKIVHCNGVKFLITHGHYYGVKGTLDRLLRAAREKGVAGVLYGHTHVATNQWIEGIYVMNPGSISLPRGGNGPTYGVIEVEDDGKITGNIIKYKSFFK